MTSWDIIYLVLITLSILGGVFLLFKLEIPSQKLPLRGEKVIIFIMVAMLVLTNAKDVIQIFKPDSTSAKLDRIYNRIHVSSVKDITNYDEIQYKSALIGGPENIWPRVKGRKLPAITYSILAETSLNNAYTARILGQWAEALKWLNMAVDQARVDKNHILISEIFTIRALVYVSMNQAYHRSDYLDSAVLDYDSAIANNSNNLFALNNQGVLFYVLNEKLNALCDFTLALNQNGNNPILWFNRANVLYNLGLNPAAINDYNECLAIDSSFSAAWNNLGCALRIENDFKTAFDCFQRSLAINSGDCLARYNRGLLNIILEKYEEAKIDLRKSIECDSSLMNTVLPLFDSIRVWQ